MRRGFILAAAAIALCQAAQATARSESDRAVSSASPHLHLLGRVSDFAGILNNAHKARLETASEYLEQRTGHQLAIVTVRSLNGQDIALFTRKLGNQWGIGRAKQNDGVVLLIAPNEGKVRIEVGIGLEKILTDDRCSQIIQTKILPRFVEGDIPGGIDAGVDALVDALK